MKRSLLLVLLFLPAGWLRAQTDFKPGYVITHANETLYGEIDYRGDKLMGQQCKFRLNGREIVEYTPYDISAYRFNNGKYYESKEVEGKKVFLEFLVKGLVNIYYGRNEAGNHYYIERADEPLTELPYEETIRITEDGKQFLYKSNTHIGLLSYYMQDAPGMQRQINDMGEPEHESLIQLAKNYHYAVCTDGSPCLVFEKKLPAIMIAVDVLGGMTGYREGGTSFAGGILLNMWMPRANEKLYFRTGLLYSRYREPDQYVNPKQERESMYKIPLMVEYIYPKSIIRPKIAYGMMLPGAPAVMGGVNIRITSLINLSLEYNADFEPAWFLIPGALFSHSVLGGLHLRF